MSTRADKVSRASFSFTRLSRAQWTEQMLPLARMLMHDAATIWITTQSLVHGCTPSSSRGAAYMQYMVEPGPVTRGRILALGLQLELALKHLLAQGSCQPSCREVSRTRQLCT